MLRFIVTWETDSNENFIIQLFLYADIGLHEQDNLMQDFNLRQKEHTITRKRTFAFIR